MSSREVRSDTKAFQRKEAGWRTAMPRSTRGTHAAHNTAVRVLPGTLKQPCAPNPCAHGSQPGPLTRGKHSTARTAAPAAGKQARPAVNKFSPRSHSHTTPQQIYFSQPLTQTNHKKSKYFIPRSHSHMANTARTTVPMRVRLAPAGGAAAGGLLWLEEQPARGRGQMDPSCPLHRLSSHCRACTTHTHSDLCSSKGIQ